MGADSAMNASNAGGVGGVIDYLVSEEKNYLAKLAARDAEFHRKNAAFSFLKQQSIYMEVDLAENSEGVDLFNESVQREGNGKGRKDAKEGEAIDPFFDPNVISSWVNDDGAKDLFIPKNLQKPWSSGRKWGKKDDNGTSRAVHDQQKGKYLEYRKVHIGLAKR